jgi:hypothetical protein
MPNVKPVTTQYIIHLVLALADIEYRRRSSFSSKYMTPKETKVLNNQSATSWPEVALANL